MIHAIKVLLDELRFDEVSPEEHLQTPPAKKAAFQDFAEWEDADTMDNDVWLDSEITGYLKV